MSAFDQMVWKQRLDSIRPICRCIFALSCAERLFPFYQWYHYRTACGDPAFLRSTLDRLWDTVILGHESCQLDFLDAYESLIPNDSDPWSELNPLAENAVAALVYACKCRVGDCSEDALWAAVQAYEAADYVAHTVDAIDFEGPEAEALILQNTLVQQEIQRQLRDLSQLAKCREDLAELSNLAQALRARATVDGRSVTESLLSRL